MKPHEVRRVLLNLLSDRPRSVEQLTEATGLDRQVVRSNLGVLRRRGEIEHEGSSGWKVSR